MKYNYIIVDSNNLYERCYHVNKLHSISNGVKLITGGIFGYIKSIQRLQRKYLTEHGQLYLVFDNHASKINLRKLIDPAYKKNRQKKSKTFYNGIRLLQTILLSYNNNCVLVYRSEYEADDLVKPLILSKIDKYDNILLVSEDLDWSRMIDYDNRRIVWYAKNTEYTSYEFMKLYGYKPTESNIVMWKTFRGDINDGIIPGVKNIRKTILLRLMDDFKDVFELFYKIEDKKYDYLGDWRDKIKKNKGRLRLNHQLVSFIGINKEQLDEFIFQCSFKPKTLKTYYDALGFDIEVLDKRLYDYLENEKRNLTKIQYEQSSFFMQPKVKRI